MSNTDTAIVAAQASKEDVRTPARVLAQVQEAEAGRRRRPVRPAAGAHRHPRALDRAVRPGEFLRLRRSERGAVGHPLAGRGLAGPRHLQPSSSWAREFRSPPASCRWPWAPWSARSWPDGGLLPGLVGNASPCAFPTCCWLSRHVAGHRRGGDPRIEHDQRHCRGGGVQRAGLCPPGARQHAGDPADDLCRGGAQRRRPIDYHQGGISSRARYRPSSWRHHGIGTSIVTAGCQPVIPGYEAQLPTLEWGAMLSEGARRHGHCSAWRSSRAGDFLYRTGVQSAGRLPERRAGSQIDRK